MAPNDSATTAPNLTGRITAALAASTTTPHLCLIRFHCTGGGHCIGAADSGGKIYIFDPNFGVMIVDPAKHPTLGAALPDQLGRRSCRARVVQYGLVSVV